jgi:hypothetical protein
MRSFLAQTINAIAKISLSSVLPLLALTGAFPQRIPAQDNIIATASPAGAMALERFIANQPTALLKRGLLICFSRRVWWEGPSS